MNRIVVSVDRSPAATAAARWEARKGAMRDVELTIVHVVQPVPQLWPGDR